MICISALGASPGRIRYSDSVRQYISVNILIIAIWRSRLTCLVYLNPHSNARRILSLSTYMQSRYKCSSKSNELSQCIPSCPRGSPLRNSKWSLVSLFRRRFQKGQNLLVLSQCCSHREGLVPTHKCLRVGQRRPIIFSGTPSQHGSEGGMRELYDSGSLVDRLNQILTLGRNE